MWEERKVRRERLRCGECERWGSASRKSTRGGNAVLVSGGLEVHGYRACAYPSACGWLHVAALLILGDMKPPKEPGGPKCSWLVIMRSDTLHVL